MKTTLIALTVMVAMTAVASPVATAQAQLPLCPPYDPGSYVNFCIRINPQPVTITVPDPDANFAYTVEVCITPTTPCVYVPTVPNILQHLSQTQQVTGTIYNTHGTYAKLNSGELIADTCEIATGNRNCLVGTKTLTLADLNGDGVTDTIAYGDDEGNLLALPTAF